MSISQDVEILQAVADDLRAIRRSVGRLARELYKQDLQKIASTPERQEIWRKCDGTLSTEEISKAVGISIRTTQYFLQDAEKSGLVVFPRRGYPKRVEDYDYIPTEWKPYKRMAAPSSTPSEPNVQQSEERVIVQ